MPRRCLNVKALGALAALVVAACPAACSPEKDDLIVGEGHSQLALTACPAKGPVSQNFHAWHDGVDISAPFGAPIFATGPGEVTASGPAQGYGQWIRIKHDDGSMTEYGHMSRRDVQVGARVNAGQQIAAVGSEGESTGPHLHLRTYAKNGDRHGIDPVQYLKARGIAIPCAGVTGDGTANDGMSCEGGKGRVIGAIAEKYLALGGCLSMLGLPQTDQMDATDGRGKYSVFEHGSIYWTEETMAHEVHGDIRTLWVSLGAEAGALGYPTGDENTTPDKKGRYSVFEKGSIYWTDKTKAHEVVVPIRDKWAELKWETGPLGYPTSGQYDVPEGKKSDFQGGSITWVALSGELVVTYNDAGATK